MASSSNIQDPLDNQERLEDDRNSGPCIRDKIHRITIMINILRPFLRCTLNWHIKDRNVKEKLKHIDDAVQKVIQDWRSSSRNQELVLSNLTKLKLIKPDMKEIYSIVAATPSRKIVFFRNTHTKSKYLPLTSRIHGQQVFVSTASNVVSFIDSLLENLKDTLSYKVDHLITPVAEQIEALEDRLRFFRNFLWFIAKRCSKQKKMKDLLIYAEFVVVNVAYLLYFCLVDDKMHETMVREMRTKLEVLVEKLNPLKAETREIYLGILETLRSPHDDTPTMNEKYLAFFDSLINNLSELSNKEAVSFFAAKDQMEILQDELRLLRFNLMDPPFDAYSKKVRTLIVHIKAVINKTGYFFYLFHVNEMNEEMVGQLNLVVSGILEESEWIKEKATHWYNELIKKSWRSNFPRTNELGFIVFFTTKLKEQLQHAETLLCPFKHQIEIVYQELESLRTDFSVIAAKLNQNEELEALLERFKDIAYHAEFIVDSLVAQTGSSWCHKLGLFDVTKEIRLVQRELKAFGKKKSSDTPAPVLSRAIVPNFEVMPDSENEVEHKTEEATIKPVGFEVAAEKIKEQLTRGSKQLTILSIVGMPGIGKTTLANSVYKDHSVIFHFHARARCCVSKVYHKESLLLEILLQVNGKSNQSPQIDGKDCVEKLYKSLKGKTYLMVIDDIWDIEAWNDLKEIFPDDNNGSRILFTTRNHSVALEVNSVPYALSLLSVEQSWKLLREKVFEEKRCPSELSHVGKQIAKICKGLPLAVVTVAGILKTTKRQQYRWERVAKSLRSKEANNPIAQNLDILELCYSHLPNYLKPCFLYFAAFRQDTVISVSKLLWLWIAEGFIHQPNSVQTSLENEAEKYLKDLIDRSLVMVSQRSSTGGVKSCRVHDLLRDFCFAKAEEEKFLHHMKRYEYDQHSTFSADSVMYQAYRLCIKCDKHVVLAEPLRVRSLLFWRFWFFDELKMINFISQFRLLRVLDLSYILTVDGIDDKDFIKITNLVHLRFLAIQIRWSCIPSKIVNLQNLETLIVTSDSRRSSYIDLPKTIWNLVHLRHLYVRKGYFTFTGRRNVFFDNSDHLDNLETLSTIEFSLRNYFEKLASKLPGLRKLSCIVKMLWDPLIIHLNQIEELKLHFEFRVQHPLQFNYPSPYLKKLILSNLGRPWDEISVIGELPNLEVLKLLEGAFVGRQWDMREGEFQKVKFLKLCNLDIQEWNACSEHLPRLERLVLHSCLRLEEIPSSALGEISTLKLIEVKECSSSVKKYVRQILNEQRDMGNDEFNV